jgi:hypothetical protein
MLSRQMFSGQMLTAVKLSGIDKPCHDSIIDFNRYV